MLIYVKNQGFNHLIVSFRKSIAYKQLKHLEG